MESSFFPSNCAVAATCGFLSHWIYFIHGEKDGKALRIIIAYLNCEVILSAYLLYTIGISKTYWASAIAINLYYFGALFSSIVTYRLAFHRLRHFPGPLGAKITKGYGLWMARNVKYIDELCNLHEAYGDIVRTGMFLNFNGRMGTERFPTGPNEISIRRVSALVAVNGPGNKCGKGSTYEPLHEHGQYALAVTRDKAHHKHRRQVWDRAFSTKGMATSYIPLTFQGLTPINLALKAYEPRIKSSVEDWLSQIASNEGSPMEISHWALLFVFDVMGKVGYSEEWGAVKDGRPNTTLHLLEVIFTPLGRLGRWIWPISWVVDTGLGNEEREAFERWSNGLLAARQKVP